MSEPDRQVEDSVYGSPVGAPAISAVAPLLKAQGLTKTYVSAAGPVTVFEDLNLEIAQGEMVAIVGPSGAGKSTLVHLLGGLDRPSGGTVRFGEFDIFELGDVDLARFRNKEVGFIFQLHHLLPEFTALENVMMPLLIRRTPPRDARMAAESLLGRVGLSGRTSHRPGEMSGGEQARVAIARALVSGPRVLFGDEPTGDLDGRTSESVHMLIREVHQSHGLTSVIVTHNERLASICDRVLQLEDGRLFEEPRR
jgi:lipoprotein-releasing system ATP-binding protein